MLRNKKDPVYRAWVSMRERCYSVTCKDYKNYGGRGIKVCARWEVFEHFMFDMGPKPSKQHSLHRIQNDLDYTPSNCKWATKEEQASNRRSSSRPDSTFQRGKGVCWSQSEGVWFAYINVASIRRNLGRFKTEEQARAARARAERELSKC